jgi:oxygen-independent coproporphyrinogen-3 oxidase
MDAEILQLLNQYDVPVPRYTSYPTVPYWEPHTITPERWLESVENAFTSGRGEVSIYVHLPYCENLCTFCACNKRITKNHGVEPRYIAAVVQEWRRYRQHFSGPPVIREIHLGGGTPTFFSPANLKLLLGELVKDSVLPNDHEFGVEVHPNYTTEAHLVALREAGCNRISVGVQDFDPEVQFVINRMQSFEQTEQVVAWARRLGFESVNVDLVYGLPRQTEKSVALTTSYIRRLKPERMAFYSYAHVPWKSKGQRRYTEHDLPPATEKWKMYHTGRASLLADGYQPIGMDHFALPHDGLYRAFREGRMHRNFMGYTTTNTKLLIGLGCSSISDSGSAFVQNEKDVETYIETIEHGRRPFTSGHWLTPEDVRLRKHILDLMCRGFTEWDESGLDRDFAESVAGKIARFEQDGFLGKSGNQIRVTARGELFIRNMASAFDARLFRKTHASATFSRAI